ncbi:MAG TPA: flavin reductase family protein [Pseudonocardiaceae bacterium]
MARHPDTTAATPDEFRAFMRHWPTGVSVVTSHDHGAPVGCTVNALMSVSLSPPLLVVALGKASTTLGAIRATGVFGVNVLAAEQRELCRRFAHGSQRDRFHGLSYRMLRRLPVLAGALVGSGCVATDITTHGDHALVFGQPQWYTVDEVGSPLVFHERAFHDLARTGEVATCRPTPSR